MPETFIRFLHASLAATRRNRATLACKFALISDFLDVLRARMNGRFFLRLRDPRGTELPVSRAYANLSRQM